MPRPQKSSCSIGDQQGRTCRSNDWWDHQEDSNGDFASQFHTCLANLVPAVILYYVQITARHNFTHDVKFEKQQEHVLVTRGIYRSVSSTASHQHIVQGTLHSLSVSCCSLSCPHQQTLWDNVCRYCRHPGYLGWFVWVIGTQLLLVNPVCVAGFSFVVRAQVHDAM